MTAAAVVRLVVLAGLVAAALLALASWAVSARRISPFSRSARVIRLLTDPVLAPIERMLVRRGGNPRAAPWWLLGIVIAAGITLLTVTRWLGAAVASARLSLGTGPRGTVRVAIYFAAQVLSVALIVRVVGSWLGAGRLRPWMRPFYLLTDWIVQPLRRIIPPLGMFDLSPLVAWVVVQLGVSLVMKLV
jgi:YggT family protein